VDRLAGSAESRAGRRAPALVDGLTTILALAVAAGFHAPQGGGDLLEFFGRMGMRHLVDHGPGVFRGHVLEVQHVGRRFVCYPGAVGGLQQRPQLGLALAQLADELLDQGGGGCVQGHGGTCEQRFASFCAHVAALH
jgi:hypothetical protein